MRNPPERTILAVDDEQMVLRLLKTMLQKSGYGVLTAASGEEALNVLSAVKQIDLLITDIVMPGMDGTELAQAVQRIRPELPVLFISGYSERLERLNAPVLAKPFSPAALVSKVRHLLDPS